MMDVHKNEKSELRLWAKDDIVPRDLQELCKQAATSISKLQERIKALDAGQLDFAKEMSRIHKNQITRIEELEAELEQYRWILAGKRSPEKGYVLLCYPPYPPEKRAVCIVDWDPEEEKNIYDDFTHWKPIILP